VSDKVQKDPVLCGLSDELNELTKDVCASAGTFVVVAMTVDAAELRGKVIAALAQVAVKLRGLRESLAELEVAVEAGKR
jgi:hypothetical protein